MEQQTQEQRLENSLRQHELELAQVTAAMHVSDGDTKEELKRLVVDLEQLIQLTKETLHTMKNKSPVTKVESSSGVSSFNGKLENPNLDMDAEFRLFQAEISSLEQTSQPSGPAASCSDESSLLKDLEALEGTKCQAPFSQEWGEHSYHNALVLSVEPSDNITSLEDIKVRVMFCNPINQSMQPCPYFLDGSCRFMENDCRFSHGHIVQFAELKEFHNPDYSLLQRDSKCLARYSDKLWYKAVVEEVQSDHRYVVKFEKYNNVATVDLEDILPIECGDHESSSDSEHESSNCLLEDDDDEASEILASAWPAPTSCALGDWEKHTRGIGSKLMEKMGYIFGQGLGKNGEGRTEPVEAVILPQGKSLDKCIELRENGLSRDPLRRKRKQLLKQKRHDAKVAAGYHHEKSSVFDFLNKKIGQSDKTSSVSSSKNLSSNFKSSSTKNLNVQSMKLDEDIRKSEKELQRLQVALSRNQNSDKIVTAQLKSKIIANEEQLLSLRKTEKSIQREQASRKDHKKLTIF